MVDVGRKTIPKVWSGICDSRCPTCEVVLITVHLKLSDDRSWWRPLVATSWQSSDRYDGARLL